MAGGRARRGPRQPDSHCPWASRQPAPSRLLGQTDTNYGLCDLFYRCHGRSGDEAAMRGARDVFYRYLGCMAEVRTAQFLLSCACRRQTHALLRSLLAFASASASSSSSSASSASFRPCCTVTPPVPAFCLRRARPPPLSLCRGPAILRYRPPRPAARSLRLAAHAEFSQTAVPWQLPRIWPSPCSPGRLCEHAGT